MLKFRTLGFVRLLLAVFAFTCLVETLTSADAYARAGRGRSAGRSFGSSQRSAPNNGYRSQPSNPNPNRGSFMRGLAGGLAGGFLGSMLFSSLGHGMGFGGMGGHGGMGFLEILLLAGLVYFGIRWWRSRQQLSPVLNYSSTKPNYQESRVYPVNNWQLASAGISEEQASDIFFRVQGAWTRRDLSSIHGMIGPEIEANFSEDLADLRRRGQVNRLENITVRQTQVVDTWNEGGEEFSRVHFLANLLDYVIDDRSGQVLDGSDSVPVRFEENWVFCRKGAGWQLVAIEQCD